MALIELENSVDGTFLGGLETVVDDLDLRARHLRSFLGFTAVEVS